MRNIQNYDRLHTSITDRNCSVHNSPFHCSGDFLSDLIQTSTASVHLKDAKTEKYIQGNLSMIEIIGFKATDEVIGLTVDDIFSEIGPFKENYGPSFKEWKNHQPEKFKRLDYQVRANKRRMELQHAFFTSRGFILFKNTMRFPVLSLDHRKVVATLSVSKNITFQRSLSGLLNLYQEYYPEKQAIQQLLRYCRLEDYFLKLPTLKEMAILFAMRQNSCRKYVAHLLDLAPDTVASHVYQLRKKLKTPDLHNVLIQLRILPMDEYNMHDQLQP